MLIKIDDRLINTAEIVAVNASRLDDESIGRVEIRMTDGMSIVIIGNKAAKLWEHLVKYAVIL